MCWRKWLVLRGVGHFNACGRYQGLSCGATVTAAPPFIPRSNWATPGCGHGPPVCCVCHWRWVAGRVVDSQGIALDHGGDLQHVQAMELERKPLNAMERARCAKAWIPACARHQQPAHRGARPARWKRLPVLVWANPVLLGMMARYTPADIIVVGLIGEHRPRGQRFVEDILGAQDHLNRAVVVAAPADARRCCAYKGAS